MINSGTGPLTAVEISPELNCAVQYLGDAASSFYNGTACATFISVSGTLYGPAIIPAGDNASPRTAFTPVSQMLSGTGTADDPFRIVTEVAAGDSGIVVRQTDSYVTGQETYRTDTTVINTSSAQIEAIVYKAADCYLQDSDSGYGEYDSATGAISCIASLAPGARIEQFYPLTSGSSFYEDSYSSVWAAVGTRQPFPNLCSGCAVNIDNGMGLSWSITVAAGASTVISHLTNFSPLGNVPLSITKSAGSATTPAGGTNSYSVVISNPNNVAVTIASITDTMAGGFSYLPGSTTGATTSDPVITGSTLTWTTPVTIAAGASVQLNFGVHVGTTPGTFYNSVSATTTGVFTVVPSGPTAPVTVTAVTINAAPVVDAGQALSGTEGSPIAINATVTDADPTDVVTTNWIATGAATNDAGSTCTFANAAAVDTTITCTDDGTWTLTLSATDGVNTSVTATTTVTVTNATPTVQITSPTDMAVVTVGNPVSVAATFTDAGTNDSHTCSIDWGDGTTTAGSCTGSHTYGTLGVPSITVTATDDDGAIGSASIGIVVADSETKVTGGGFIVDGQRISFGFVAARSPTGVLRGQIQIRGTGRDRFHGGTVSTLTVSGSSATWSGTGRWNGTDGYTFSVSVTDNRNGGGRGTADTIVIRVTDAAGNVVLSGSGALRGGNITVHR